MIYLDSGATTLEKPPEVARAMARAVGTMSSPGRGNYPASRRAEQTAFACREAAAGLFQVPTPDQVVFTSNATHGLNIAIRSLVRPGGRLSVAHGMSRAAIDSHHSGAAHPVSNGLMHEDALRALLTPYCDVDICISDERMYQVAGIRR